MKTLVLVVPFVAILLIFATLQADAERLPVDQKPRPKAANRRLLITNQVQTGDNNTDDSSPEANPLHGRPPGPSHDETHRKHPCPTKGKEIHTPEGTTKCEHRRLV